MFLRGCSDHRDQLFCLFELKKASLALRIRNFYIGNVSDLVFNLHFRRNFSISDHNKTIFVRTSPQKSKSEQ